MGQKNINEVVDPNAESRQPQPAKIGAWKGGWLLAKASWSTLKLDKELALFPVISAIMSVVILAIIGVLFYLTGTLIYGRNPSFENVPQWMEILFGFLFYLGIYTVTSFYSGAIIASALHRFNGGDPTVGYGIGEAKKRFGSIFKFSLFSATIGYILRLIQERAGIAGKIFAFIGDIAWGILTIFAIPVIMSREEPIGPIATVKESAGVFKKCWAKNYAGGITMGAIFFLIFLLWLVFSGGIIIASIVYSPITLFITAPIAGIALLVMISVSSALSSIFQAAVFHYATTGESPVNFEKDLLQAAFRPKKGWFA